MMELPESYALSKQISEYLKGKIISEIKLLQTPHKFAFFKGEVNEYADMLEGQTIEKAVYKGGMLEIDTEDAMIVFSKRYGIGHIRHSRRICYPVKPEIDK